MDVQRFPQYFENWDSFSPCPVRTVLQGFQRFYNRRALLGIAAAVCILYMMYLSTDMSASIIERSSKLRSENEMITLSCL